MKKAILILTTVTLAFSACKKDDGGSGSNNGSSALTSGKWKITAISSVIEYPSPVGTQTIDGMSAFQSCQLDNLYVFNTDGTGTLDEGATKCNANDPQQKQNGTWALMNSNTQLTVSDLSGTTITSDVLTLNNTTLKIRYVTNYNNIRNTTTTTYTKQ